MKKLHWTDSEFDKTYLLFGLFLVLDFKTKCDWNVLFISIIIISSITSADHAGGGRSVCHSVNKVIDKRGNGRRPNLTDMGKGWPSRSD